MQARGKKEAHAAHPNKEKKIQSKISCGIIIELSEESNPGRARSPCRKTESIGHPAATQAESHREASGTQPGHTGNLKHKLNKRKAEGGCRLLGAGGTTDGSARFEGATRTRAQL